MDEIQLKILILGVKSYALIAETVNKVNNLICSQLLSKILLAQTALGLCSCKETAKVVSKHSKHNTDLY